MNLKKLFSKYLIPIFKNNKGFIGYKIGLKKSASLPTPDTEVDNFQISSTDKNLTIRPTNNESDPTNIIYHLLSRLESGSGKGSLKITVGSSTIYIDSLNATLKIRQGGTAATIILRSSGQVAIVSGSPSIQPVLFVGTPGSETEGILISADDNSAYFTATVGKITFLDLIQLNNGLQANGNNIISQNGYPMIPVVASPDDLQNQEVGLYSGDIFYRDEMGGLHIIQSEPI